MVFHKTVPIAWGLCACSAAPAKEIQITCNNKKSYPGIPCNIALPIMKVLYKVSMALWKLYTTAANLCKVPIIPI